MNLVLRYGRRTFSFIPVVWKLSSRFFLKYSSVSSSLKKHRFHCWWMYMMYSQHRLLWYPEVRARLTFKWARAHTSGDTAPEGSVVSLYRICYYLGSTSLSLYRYRCIPIIYNQGWLYSVYLSGIGSSDSYVGCSNFRRFRFAGVVWSVENFRRKSVAAFPSGAMKKLQKPQHSTWSKNSVHTKHRGIFLMWAENRTSQRVGTGLELLNFKETLFRKT
jgi:hypothetical protein